MNRQSWATNQQVMTIEEFRERAVCAVRDMTEATALRIAEGDASSIVIAFPEEQPPGTEHVAALRQLLHRLCRERVGLAA
jgi:hypothetical protein